MRKVFTIFIVACLMFGLSSCARTIRTNSIEDYLEANVPIICAELQIFPVKESLEETTVDLYQSTTVTTLLFDETYFLLRCNYNLQEYEKEVLRLEEIGAQYADDLFRYPAYIMIFSYDFYEYALLDDENHSIIYVFAMTPGLGNSKSSSMLDDFPEDYLPIARPKVDIEMYEYN